MGDDIAAPSFGDIGSKADDLFNNGFSKHALSINEALVQGWSKMGNLTNQIRLVKFGRKILAVDDG